MSWFLVLGLLLLAGVIVVDALGILCPWVTFRQRATAVGMLNAAAWIIVLAFRVGAR